MTFSRTTSFSVRLAIFSASLGLFIALWEVAALSAGNSLILVGPIPVLQALVGLLQNHLPRGALGLQSANAAILQTLATIVFGFGLACIVGIPVGIVMGRWKTAETVIDPWLSAAYSIPIVVLIPMLYFAIGADFFAEVFVTFLLTVFTIIVNTHNGVKYVSNALAEVGKSYGASETQFIAKIVLPASMPDILSGMRIGMGRAILAAVLAEVLMSGNGLGGMMMTFQDVLNTPYMMAAVFLIALMGVAVLQLPKILERRLFRWKETESLSRGVRR
jgi:ABC-type nitrate/sulfonate/bicarbonate transport system permease component